MNLLMICYYFPPLADVGCKRSVFLCQFLKRNGWNPIVLSVKNPDKDCCYISDDPPPQGIATEYTRSLVNFYRLTGKLNGALSRLMGLAGVKLKRNIFYDMFCLPDPFIGWIPLTLVTGLRKIRTENIDAIYVSCSPFSSALTGLLLKFFTKKPLIVDFRDPFAQATEIFRVPPFRKRILKVLERKIVERCDILILNTNETRKLYVDSYPQYLHKFHTVHNGFDTNFACQIQADKFKKFTIVYAGQFYFYDERCDKYTEGFFRGLSLLKASGHIDARNFQFLYFGDAAERIKKIAGEHGVADLVESNSRRPYHEIVEVIKMSHLQLLRIVKPMISTKLFEGIALDVPFIATIPDGEVKDIIRTYSEGSYIISDGSFEKIADAILEARRKYDAGSVEHNRVEEFLQCFSRENLSKKFIKIVSDTLQESSKLYGTRGSNK